MGNDYTDQHIVPKRYLDRFGVSDGKRTMIGTRIVKKDEVKFFMDLLVLITQRSLIIVCLIKTI